jgi:hypothetical protein
MATKTNGKGWTHKSPRQLRAMSHEEKMQHLRAVLADARAHGVKIDLEVILLRVITAKRTPRQRAHMHLA